MENAQSQHASTNPSVSTSNVRKVYTNDDIVRIRPTMRKGDVWSNYDLCVMIDGVEKARCKKCSKFYNPTSNTTLRTHKSGCSAVSQNDTSQGTIGADGQVFIFDNDAVRLDFTKFVIQQALPFNHFDNVKLTEIIKKRLQPRYQHVSRTTLRSDAFKLWETAKKDIIDGFRDYKYGVSITTDTWTAPHGEIQFPILSAMARDLLTVQASTVASESAFSISGRIISERRSRLTPESVEAREEVDVGKSPRIPNLMEGEFEDLDIEHRRLFKKKAKNINGEAHIHAKVDGKKEIISEVSIRRDLKFEDEGGVDFLSNEVIFEQLTLIRYENLSQKLTFYKAFFSPQWKFLIHTILQCLTAKTIAWNEFSSTMDFEIICLATNQKFNFSKYIFNSMMKHLDSGNKFLMYPRKSKKNDTKETQPSDPTLNVADEALNEERVPTHSNDPLLSGEDSLKLTELLELCTNLQQRVIDLETTKTSQAQEIASLKKRVKKLEKIKNLGEEDASKQGRIADIDANEEVTLVNESAEDQGRNNDQDMFGVNANLHVSTSAPITIAVTIDELTMAQTLVEIKKSKPKAKGIIMQEPSEATTTTIPIPLKVQDKGKAQQEKEANIALIKQWHDVQAKIEADYELAQRLQAEEQEQLTDVEKARLFMEFLKKRRKFFAAKREIEKRNRPPTKAQQRSLMCTYLKNMDGWKPKALKTKSFPEIQKLFDQAFKRVNTFVDFRTELVEGSSKEIEAQKVVQKRAVNKMNRKLYERKNGKKRMSEELKNI
ncbi:ribonuclease H-like domain, reverse transcriptase, RNA-dependent DNA polymerase [Tanacetum coccineum]